jgi:hypothetical protein
MLSVTKNISPFIREQFPDIYKEDAQFLIDFTKTYYDFVDTTMDRDIPKLRDIDTTLANFLIFYKKKYLLNLPLTDANNDVPDTRFIVKHIQDLYTRKGSEESLRLLFKLFYNTEIEVYYPSTAIFKSSDSVWEDRIYLEMFPLSTMLGYPISKGDKLTGSITGASGYVDEIIFINFTGALTPVAYLSNVLGNFLSDDSIEITRTSGAGVTTSTSAGKLIRGSITALSILPGSKPDQKLGELLKVKSAKSGVEGTAIVRELAKGNTSTIGFEITRGGFGYVTPLSGNRVTLSNQVIVLQQSLSPTIEVGDPVYSHGSVVSAISAEGTSIGSPSDISGGGRVIEYQHPLLYLNSTDQNKTQFLNYVYQQLGLSANGSVTVNAEMERVFNREVGGRRLGVLRDSISNGGYNSSTGRYITTDDAAKFLLYKNDVLATPNTVTAGAAAKALIEDKLLPAIFATGTGYKFDNGNSTDNIILPDNGQVNIIVDSTALNTVGIGKFNESASYEVSGLSDTEDVTFITDLVGDFIQKNIQVTVDAVDMLQNKTYIIDVIGGTTPAQWHTAAGTQSTNASGANYHANYVVGDTFTAVAAAESVTGSGKVIDVDATDYQMSGSGKETLYTQFKDAFTPVVAKIGTISDIKVTQAVDAVYQNAVFSEVEFDSVSKFNKTNAILTINESPTIAVGDTVTQTRTIEDPTLQGGANIQYEVKGRCVGKEDGTNNYKFIQLKFYDFIPSSGESDKLVHDKSARRLTVNKVSRDSNSLPMGRNALITTTSNDLVDQITKVSPVKSGFRYDNGEEVDLLKSVTIGNFVVGLEYTITETSPDFANIVDGNVAVPETSIVPVGTVFTATGAGTGTGTADTVVARATLTTLGQGQKGGSWQDATSFASENTRRLADNFYYQEYSYDISSIIPSAKYTTLIDDIVGVAGTKMFSSPLINTSNDLLSLSMDVELAVWDISSEVYETETSPSVENIVTSLLPTGTITSLVITDTDFSVTCDPTNIAVGHIVKITGTKTGSGSITGYTTGKNYVVSSIDVGTAPLVTGFTLVDTNGSTAVVTTSGTPGGLVYKKFTVSEQLHATIITLETGDDAQPTVSFSTP